MVPIRSIVLRVYLSPGAPQYQLVLERSRGNHRSDHRLDSGSLRFGLHSDHPQEVLRLLSAAIADLADRHEVDIPAQPVREPRGAVGGGDDYLPSGRLSHLTLLTDPGLDRPIPGL